MVGGNSSTFAGTNITDEVAEKIVSEQSLERTPSQIQSLRGWLNKEWAAVTLPMFAFAGMDGFIKFAGTGQSLYMYQAAGAGGLAVLSVLGRSSATIKQGVLTLFLAVAGAGAGIHHARPVANEGVKQWHNYINSLPKITPETMIPASVLYNQNNSNGTPHIEKIKGKEYAFTCPAIEVK